MYQNLLQNLITEMQIFNFLSGIIINFFFLIRFLFYKFTLKHQLRPFDGLYKDLSRKLKYYTSDFADSFNMQCIASTIYMYLVCLCSLVAFGGMLGEKLNNDMVSFVV